MKGIIESYSEQKRFGFINADNGTRAYFYRESIEVNGYMPIKPGDRVSFEIVETTQGPEARKIRLLKDY